jgi:hypothetical protein
MKPADKVRNKVCAKRGQALVELAIFGSILLFCVTVMIQYALEGSYSQQVQMEAFRRAQKLAYYKSGPGSASAVTLIKDKPIPDLRDQWGFAERSPVMGSGSVAWDSAMAGMYVKSFSNQTKSQLPDASDLPTMYFMVANATLSPELKNAAQGYVPSGAGQNQVFGFHNAQFEKLACASTTSTPSDSTPNGKRGTITVVRDNPDCPKNGGECNDYLMEEVPCSAIKVMLFEPSLTEVDGQPRVTIEVDTDVDDYTELLMSAYYIDPTGLKRRISAADLDGDNRLEDIIAVNKDMIFLYIDSHIKNDKPGSEGTPVETQQDNGNLAIDTDYAAVSPYPYGEKYSDPDSGKLMTINDRQSMLTDFNKTITHTGSSFVKTETKGVDTITTSTTLNASQKIIRKIRLNDGQEIIIPSEFIVQEIRPY